MMNEFAGWACRTSLLAMASRKDSGAVAKRLNSRRRPIISLGALRALGGAVFGLKGFSSSEAIILREFGFIGG